MRMHLPGEYGNGKKGPAAKCAAGLCIYASKYKKEESTLRKGVLVVLFFLREMQVRHPETKEKMHFGVWIFLFLYTNETEKRLVSAGFFQRERRYGA